MQKKHRWSSLKNYVRTTDRHTEEDNGHRRYADHVLSVRLEADGKVDENRWFNDRILNYHKHYHYFMGAFEIFLNNLISFDKHEFWVKSTVAAEYIITSTNFLKHFLLTLRYCYFESELNRICLPSLSFHSWNISEMSTNCMVDFGISMPCAFRSVPKQFDAYLLGI